MLQHVKKLSLMCENSEDRLTSHCQFLKSTANLCVSEELVRINRGATYGYTKGAALGAWA